MRRHRTESFLLRIVAQEEHSQLSEEWRGRIQHIGTGVEQSFASIEELITFMAAHLVPVADESITHESTPHS